MTPVAAALENIKEELREHRAEDTQHFAEQRHEMTESLRRMYERFEAALKDLDGRQSIRFAEMGTKVDTAVTGIVAKTNELDKARIEADIARARAEGEAAGIEKAKQPSPTRLAVIGGVATQITSIVAAVLGAVVIAAGMYWLHDNPTRAPVSAVALPR